MVERHLVTCGDCREIVACCEAIAAKCRHDRDPRLAAHPDPERLREFVLDPTTQDRQLARHLSTCEQCALECTAWRIVRSPLAPTKGPVSWFSVRSAAVGAALGIAASWLAPLALRPTPDGVAEGEWHGRAQILVLSSTARGGSSLASTIVTEGQPYVPVSVPVSIPEALSDGTSIRFELTREHDQVLWEETRSVKESRLELAETSVITLLLPANDLGSGEYRLTVRGTSADNQPFTAVYRFELRR